MHVTFMTTGPIIIRVYGSAIKSAIKNILYYI